MTTTTSSANNSSVSSIVQSFLAGEQDSNSIVCNDPQGLCLHNNHSSKQDTGVYSNLVRLAAQLSQDSNQKVSPLITIETDSQAILVKEYADHAVAFTVAKSSSSSDASLTTTNGTTSAGTN